MKKTKSMLETAYDIVEKGPIVFEDLVERVAKELEMTEDEVKERRSQFYTSLSLDQRFFNNHGSWDLAINFKYDDRKVEIRDLSSDEDEVTEKDIYGSDGNDDDYDHNYSDDSEEESSEEENDNDTL